MPTHAVGGARPGPEFGPAGLALAIAGSAVPRSIRAVRHGIELELLRARDEHDIAQTLSEDLNLLEELDVLTLGRRLEAEHDDSRRARDRQQCLAEVLGDDDERIGVDARLTRHRCAHHPNVP
jgi:hypothetical protein